MSKYRMLLKAAVKKQKGSIIGIFLLMFVLALCLFSALTVYISGMDSVDKEMDRLGFGDFTVWVNRQPDRLPTEIEDLPDVDHVLTQPLIFAGYEINGSYSDNEGQLIVCDGSVPYRFLTAEGEELPIPEIEPGTVYISPALCSGFDVQSGDTIQFELSRSNGIKSLTVAGYFADAFMGSSMIDMKSFLISDPDWEEMQRMISEAADADTLGRVGAMLHIFQRSDSALGELGLAIGDIVQVASGGRMETYQVSGIYQCANGMGSNIGMSIQGYSKIGDITGFIWCCHYILENGSVRDYAMAYLQEHYRGIDVHTNSWSGLDGIVFVMHTLIAVIYLIAALFILAAVALTAGKLLQSETGKMAICKSMGLSSGRLRLSFAFRFLIVVIIGAGIGIFLSVFCADAVIESIFKMFGIGEFSSGFSVLGTVLPMVIIPLLFFGFALAFSAKIKRVSIVNLIAQNDG